MFDTDIYKWSSGSFTLVEQGDQRPLFGLRNAKAVRARLKKIRLGHPAARRGLHGKRGCPTPTAATPASVVLRPADVMA